MKARLKKLEDMPAWAKCCPSTIKAIRLCEYTVFELQGNPYHFEYPCPSCGAPYSGMAYHILRQNSILHVDLIDIDEGS